jgi:hypothetical protein
LSLVAEVPTADNLVVAVLEVIVLIHLTQSLEQQPIKLQLEVEELDYVFHPAPLLQVDLIHHLIPAVQAV